MDWQEQQRLMVEEQIRKRGVVDSAVLAAFETVPRSVFVSPNLQELAYSDTPLPISEGQTISQPYVVALMLEAAGITSSSSVLEVGTGSGYAAALISRIAAQVFTIERIASLAEESERRFRELKYENIQVKVGDGTLGWEEKAPFDAIIVSAAASQLPSPLYKQLNLGGHLIIPIGDLLTQELYCITKKEEGQLDQKRLQFVRFVPLIGEHK